MERNQTAYEIAKEYELMAIDSANQHFRLKRSHPFSEFPALRKHVELCTLMNTVWDGIAKKLDSGPEMYESDDYYGEYGI